MPGKLASVLSALALAGLFATATPARAEVSSITVAEQYGISYLPMMIMADQKLIEKHAAAEGLPPLQVQWKRFAGGNVMNDALLAHRLDFASGGVAPLVLLWARTKGLYDVKGVASMTSMPLYLDTTNPKIHSLADFGPDDRIALPAVRVSYQAMLLQMACSQAFGAAQAHKLDPLTISMSHPDGMLAMLGGRGGVDAHFTAPPYEFYELKDPRVHRVVSSYDLLGGPSTFTVVWATSQFHDQNPKVYKAFFDALEEAIAMVNHDKPWAARTYLRLSGDKHSEADILALLENPEISFTTTPRNVMKDADFMAQIGTIKTRPASWKDMFFDNLAGRDGS